MTCVIGYLSGGNAYLAADSEGSNYASKDIFYNRKVFYKNGLLIGCAGSYRAIQLLKYKFNPPMPEQIVDLPKTSPDAYYMNCVIADSIKAVFTENGFAEIENNKNNAVNSYILIMFKNRIYEVQSDYSIIETVRNFSAIGCGADHARGAMFVLDPANLQPEKKLELAIEAAKTFCPGVGGPVNIVRNKKDRFDAVTIHQGKLRILPDEIL